MNIQSLETAIEDLLNDFLVTDPSYFLVEVSIAPLHNIRIFIDGDQDVSIDKCLEWNRSIYKKIEAKNWFNPGDFSLEVSSPGLDKPLKMHRQYIKNINRMVEVVQKNNTKIIGQLITVDDSGISIQTQEGKGKKMIQKQTTILFSSIKTTIIQSIF